MGFFSRYGAKIAKRDGWKCHWCGIMLSVTGGFFGH